jgi:hypothetical protein
VCAGRLVEEAGLSLDPDTLRQWLQARTGVAAAHREIAATSETNGGSGETPSLLSVNEEFVYIGPYTFTAREEAAGAKSGERHSG